MNGRAVQATAPHAHKLAWPLWLAGSLVLCTPLAQARESVAVVDAGASHFGFELSTHIGQRLKGQFASGQGRLQGLADGRQRVRLQLDTASVQIDGSDMHTRNARGEGFFDADNHPRITFVSEPFDPALLREGGAMRGQLTMRGVTRNETLQVSPSRCQHPGQDCALVVAGSIRRDTYGMTRWRAMVSSQVRLNMQVRLRENVQ